jgi:hypothetical protein
VTIARAVVAVAAGRVVALAVAAAGRGVVAVTETEIEIAARVATTDKQNNSSAGQKTGATFLLQAALANLRTRQQLRWVGDMVSLGLHLG